VLYSVSVGYRKVTLKTLYSRLHKAGFSRSFLKSAVLPEWWDDNQANSKDSIAIAELAIARNLGFRIHDLRQDSPLTLHANDDVRLKRNKNVEWTEVQPGIIVAKRLARIAAEQARGLATGSRNATASQVRAAILAKSSRIDLYSLLEYCWSIGIVVLHLHQFPGGKKFDGMAIIVDGVPVIILGSGKDSPAWLAFHLAHELGHILLGHVKDGEAIAEVALDKSDQDPIEVEADSFAAKLLTDDVTRHLVVETNKVRLQNLVISVAKQARTSPCILALFNARISKLWALAQLIIKDLGESEGAKRAISDEFAKHVQIKDAGSKQRFLNAVTHVNVSE